MEVFYVYQLRLDGDKLPFYIGKGSGRRINNHFNPSKLKEDTFKNRVILKALSDNIKIHREVLCTGMIEEDALASEIHLIKSYGRRCDNTGYLANTTLGGDGTSGLIHKPRTVEHCKKISDALTGKKSPSHQGENCCKAKLITEDILIIRQLSEDGVRHTLIGWMFNVLDSTICRIVQRKLWAHVA